MSGQKIIYWLSTGVFCLIMLFSSYMYVFNYDNAHSFFVNLGFPVWMIYPSAILKFLGVLAILSKKSNFLKEWAYAGFFFDPLIALSAHLIVKDGAYGLAAIALVTVVISYYMDGRLYGNAAIPANS